MQASQRESRERERGRRKRNVPGKKLSKSDDLRTEVEGKHGRVGRVRQDLRKDIVKGKGSTKMVVHNRETRIEIFLLNKRSR